MSMEDLKQKMEHLKMNHSIEIINKLLDEATKKKSSHINFLEKVLSLEVQEREVRRIATALKISALPKGMRLENFDFLFQPSVEKERIDFLSSCEFIRQSENILFFGPPGVGKTHLAVGLGVKAIELGFSVIYYTVEELLQQLKKRTDKPVSKQRGRAYVKNALVIVDELGYQVMDRVETHLFFQFISTRYMKGSTIFTSNRSIRDWVHIFAGDEMAATAILDRLFHKSHIFNIDGRSFRLKDYNNLMKSQEKNAN